MGKFRAPTLRNIALTAPYMLDGSLQTLEQVIDFYADAGRNITTGKHRGDSRENPYKSAFIKGFQLTEQEKQDLVAFLHTFTEKSLLKTKHLVILLSNNHLPKQGFILILIFTKVYCMQILISI